MFKKVAKLSSGTDGQLNTISNFQSQAPLCLCRRSRLFREREPVPMHRKVGGEVKRAAN